jgi:hypothetical protein
MSKIRGVEKMKPNSEVSDQIPKAKCQKQRFFKATERQVHSVRSTLDEDVLIFLECLFLKMRVQYNILNKSRNRYYSVAFFISLLLIIWEISLYRRTFIDVDTLIGIILLAGLIGTLADFKAYFRTYEYQSQFIGVLTCVLINTCIWGFTSCTALMASNYYLRDEVTTIESYRIVDRYTLSGRRKHREKRKPVFTIKHRGKRKDIHFSNDYIENFETYEKVKLHIVQGFWGFDVITQSNLELQDNP